ncbi:MAG TPA: DNA-directed RNA polymerase subunit alpha C-terminal domain-containing protein, partial [Longimicrobiales bacterium]
TEEQMLDIENFGVKSLEEIRQFLKEHNLHFGMKLEEGEDGELYLVERTGEEGGAEGAEVTEEEQAS